MKKRFLSVAALNAVFGWSSVYAQPAIFKDADLKLGEKLIAENKCVACHVSKVGGDGSAIYKPQGRINTAAFCVAWWSNAIPS